MHVSIALWKNRRGNTEMKKDKIEGIRDCEINRLRKKFKYIKSNEKKREVGK